MNRENKLAVAGCVVLAIMVCFTGAAYSGGTELIPDDRLLEAISDQLGPPGEEITAYNMLDLVTLSASGVRDLTGLRQAENLERLRLGSLDPFAAIEPLVELENLEVLEITDSSITSGDLEGMEGLENLEILMLGGNRIEDISPISGLTGLEELYLSDNELVELEGMEGLESLRVLDLAGNHLISITQLVALENLDYLDVSGNQLKGVGPLLNNEGLGENDVIKLHNNLLDFSPNSTTLENVQALKSKGIQVTCLPQRTQVKEMGQKTD